MKKGERKYITVAKDVYQAALEEDWNGMIYACSGRSEMYVMSPVTVSEDTPLHLAVYSKKVWPLEDLLHIAHKNPMLGNPCTKQNAYGNTVLHEAVFAGNMEAVEYLLQFTPKRQGDYDPSSQLQTKNTLGETPLYRAAACGKKEIVDYLFLMGKLSEDHRRRVDSKPILHAAIQGHHFDTAQGEYDPSRQLQTKIALGETPLYRAAACGKKEIVERLFSEGELLEGHRKRGSDSNPILHAAIQGHHFDTALTLLEKDPSLYKMKDNQGMTCLHVLAGIPSAFKSGYALRQITIKNLIYCCLSAAKGDGDQSRSEKGWPLVERIRKEKHRHGSALELAKELIKMNQLEWWQSIKVKPTKVNIKTPGQGGRGGQSERQGGGGIPGGGRERQDGAREGAGEGGGGGEVENNENGQPKIEENRRQETPPSPPNPLFIATSNGIVEIAEEILAKFPQAIELVNDEGQNILHVAVMHRRREIFRLVKKKNIVVTRMSSSVDNNGFTLLHQVAHVKHYSGGAKPGPALQLQEEIQWFKRVQRVVPPSLSEQRVQCVLPKDKNCKLMTAIELFQEEHKDQLKLAQNWIERTSQSCSAVAVLLATVVFAAAYTIPGGSDDRGFPIFLHNRFFIAFTVLDVTALVSSLTSVVMFLSILTTPFECEKFYQNIPRKLRWGFTLLFFSVMTTMLAFSCTLLLVIRLKKQWTTGLMSIAAFLPVTVFAGMQFPLYVAFRTTVKTIGILKKYLFASICVWRPTIVFS